MLAPEVNAQFLSFIYIKLEKVLATPGGKPLYCEAVILDGRWVFEKRYYSSVVRKLKE